MKQQEVVSYSIQLNVQCLPENFATLCANGSGQAKSPVGESGKELTYRNSKVHRVETGFVLQAGDFVMGNGAGGESIFGRGKKFKDGACVQSDANSR